MIRCTYLNKLMFHYLKTRFIVNNAIVNPLTRKGQYTGRFTKCTENAKASILAATTRNQTNSHSFNLVRPRIKVFIYYYSPLNSV